LFFPSGEPAKTRYSAGGGAALLLDLDLSGIWPNPLGLGYTAGIEGGMNYAPLASGAEGSLNLYSLGAGLSLYYYPLSRLLLRLDGAGGLYEGVLDESRTPNGFWARGGVGVGFRFTPGFVLSANGGYRYYHDRGGALHSGFYTGIALQFNFETASSAGAVELSVIQGEGIFPAYLSLYQTNPLGTLIIQNNENAEIRDVRVSFRAGSYTASEFPCGSIPFIAKGQPAELPLYADFSPEVLRFTDRGRISGEAVIRYTFLGEERQVLRDASIRVHNRNSFPAGDDGALAAFVSPASPEILEYAKYITGLARNYRRTGLNQNMQSALWLFEGLRAGGIRTVKEENRGASLREVQFPVETLGFRTGGRADTGLLYAAALEAAGIRAALIPLSEDFVCAISLNVSRAQAESLFNDLDRVLVVDDEVWLPLSMEAFNAGFSAAWEKGAAALSAVFASGETADFIVLEDRWAVYPPAPLPEQGIQFKTPETNPVRENTESAVKNYIASEIEPLLRGVQAQLQRSPTAVLQNRLGVLLVRAGRFAEARAAYERAAGMGSAAAMTNRGNLALQEKDAATAEKWFRQALAASPDNANAKRGLEQAAELRE
jgi:hypothetical protein